MNTGYSSLAAAQAQWNLSVHARPDHHDVVLIFAELLEARRANDSSAFRAAVRRLRAAGLSVVPIAPESAAIHDRSGVGR